ncbi:MAG: glycosyltransferase family 2 protein [Saprospiraceae bacterium]
MNKKIISVIMSVYNTDFYLVKRAIDSVLSQDYPYFELIIVDDGSDNATEFLLLNYVRQHQDKITYIRHKNRGQSQSINRGILISSGQFITIIDADDEYKVNHLRSCLQEMQNTDLIASTTHTVVNNETDYYVPDRMDHSKVIHVDNCVLFATLFGKKEVFTSVQFLDTYAADAHFYEHVAQTYRVQKVDLRTYIYYRNIPNSICANLKSAYCTSLS